MLTIGSLCTGIGGLDLAVESHFGAYLLWYSDIDPGANRVMARHRPDALSMGDFTTVDPDTVEVPDILTAGFPCQSVSVAGRHEGTTSPFWLFDDIVKFIEALPSRPTWMVLEKVRLFLQLQDLKHTKIKKESKMRKDDRIHIVFNYIYSSLVNPLLSLV